MGAFTGSLNSNEIFSAIYNMIISQQVFADNIKGTYGQLMEMSRVDGSLYGDTKLYYATDALKSTAWGNDAEASNLLALHRPPAPSCQAITLNIFRKIAVTVDNYLSKRAWATEGAFSQFNSVMLGWLRETKKIYDSTTFNAFLGTDYTSTGKQSQSVLYQTGDSAEENARLQAQNIAKGIADLIADMEDIGTGYNDYGYLRSYAVDELVIVWNIEWVNKFTKLDLPTIFHKDIFGSEPFRYRLPARYFGTKNTTKATADANTRALNEVDYTYNSTAYHAFAGDSIHTGATLYSGGEVKIPSYQVDPSIVCKIMHKRSIPFMSAFEVGTSFFNALSLTENHYLIWGHNTLEHLMNYPMVTVKGNAAIYMNLDGFELSNVVNVATGAIALSQLLGRYVQNASGSVSYAVTGLPTGITYAAGSVNGTPTVAGIYNVKVVATDAGTGATATDYFRWTITAS